MGLELVHPASDACDFHWDKGPAPGLPVKPACSKSANQPHVMTGSLQEPEKFRADDQISGRIRMAERLKGHVEGNTQPVIPVALGGMGLLLSQLLDSIDI